MRDAERDFLAGSLQHVLELREDRLCRFRPEIGDAVLALHGANVGLEHQVERAWLGEEGAVVGVVTGGVFDGLFAPKNWRWFNYSSLLVEVFGDL